MGGNGPYVHSDIRSISRANSAGATVFAGWRLERGLYIRSGSAAFFPNQIVAPEAWSHGMAIGHGEPTTEAEFELLVPLTARSAVAWATLTMGTTNPLYLTHFVGRLVETTNLVLSYGWQCSGAGFIHLSLDASDYFENMKCGR